MKFKLLSSIIFLICISLFLALGFWQLDRANEKEQIIKLYEKRQLAEPVNLVIFPKNNIANTFYKNYKIKGKYLNKTFLLDNKIKNKKPGFNVLSLFKVAKNGEIILVDRGWILMEGARQDIEENYKFLNNYNKNPIY